MLPSFIVHADWGSNPKKRWMACAALQPDGSYEAFAPQPVGEPGTLLARLGQNNGDTAPHLVGFDFPIGIPIAYAQKIGVQDFLTWLPELGTGRWADFYQVAQLPAEISLERPFYPLHPGHATQEHLLRGLGVENMNGLRRRCELPHPSRRAAAPLFWTLGGQQVGKAALLGWREVLVPALLHFPDAVKFWPFSGSLNELLQPRHIIITETYPTEFYHLCGLDFSSSHLPKNDRAAATQRPKTGKRSPQARAAQAPALLECARRAKILLAPLLQELINNGFGPSPDGEDPFDTFIGLLGMIHVLQGDLASIEPQDWESRRVEGWIFGQSPSIL